MTGRKSGGTLKGPCASNTTARRTPAVASRARTTTQWYYNLLAKTDITVQDGTDVRRAPQVIEAVALVGLCVAAFRRMPRYQAGTDRAIRCSFSNRR